MQSVAGDIALGSDGRNDGHRSVVSDLVRLIEHVQASLRLIEQTMVQETSLGGQENADDVIVLDDISPRYVKATAALKACDANLGVALHVLLDSRTPGRGASGFGEVPLSILRM
jgi:hypothetical protein